MLLGNPSEEGTVQGAASQDSSICSGDMKEKEDWGRRAGASPKAELKALVEDAPRWCRGNWMLGARTTAGILSD